jgi:hypothetical protein
MNRTNPPTNEVTDPRAQAIEREHQEVLSHGRSTLEHAAACGRLLLEAQPEVNGNWGDWIKDNLSFGWRQAQKYTRFARAVAVKPELLNSDCSLDQVLKLSSDSTAPGQKEKAKAKAKGDASTKAARSSTPDAGKWIGDGLGIDAPYLRRHYAALDEQQRKHCIDSLKAIRGVLDRVISEAEHSAAAHGEAYHADAA